MIEITRAPEESRENLRKIPRNIRQIGNTTGYGKIYMEDMVYQFLSEGGIEEGQHLTTYLLLGEDFYQKEEQYLFIRGALELENMTYSRDFPVFSEEIWNDIYKGMRKYFQDEKILGWAINRKGGRLDYCGEMETICRRHFHGENQMVLFFDTADDDEMIYLYHGGRYIRKEGYHIYYEKNTKFAEYLTDYHRRKEQLALQRKREMKLRQQRELEESEAAAAGGTGSFADAGEGFSASDREPDFQRRHLGEETLRNQASLELEKKFYETSEEESLDGITFRQRRKARQERENAGGRNRPAVAFGRTAGWEEDPVSRYRDFLRDKERRPMKAKTRALVSAAALVLVILGAFVIQNYMQMEDMEDAVDAIAQQQAKEDVLETISGTAEDLAGNGTDASGQSSEGGNAAGQSGGDASQGTGAADAAAQGTDQSAGGTDASSQNDAAGANQGTGTDAAAQTAQTNEYLAQGYYIVQEGDKLLDISRKVYGNDNMVAAICEANGITNIDHIQVGDRLQLPNP